MERVFDAAEQDGKLYQVFNSFYISTIIQCGEWYCSC